MSIEQLVLASGNSGKIKEFSTPENELDEKHTTDDVLENCQ